MSDLNKNSSHKSQDQIKSSPVKLQHPQFFTKQVKSPIIQEKNADTKFAQKQESEDPNGNDKPAIIAFQSYSKEEKITTQIGQNIEINRTEQIQAMETIMNEKQRIPFQENQQDPIEKDKIDNKERDQIQQNKDQKKIEFFLTKKIANSQNIQENEENFQKDQDLKKIENVSNVAIADNETEKISFSEQKINLKSLNQNQINQPQIDYSKVYCYGNAESDQFLYEKEVNGEIEEFYETKRPFEIAFFNQTKKKLIKMVCGSVHNLALTEQGEIFSWGNNDSKQLGREGKPRTPGLVKLSEPVDILAAGESFSIAANSKTGTIFFWGKLKSRSSNILEQSEPLEIKYGLFMKHKVQDIKCGQNHILVLSGERVYVWGDKSNGALGNHFRKEKSRVDFSNPTCINKRGIARIFTTDYSSFILTKQTARDKRGTIFAFGLNNHNQLGFESVDENLGVEALPVKWTEIHGDEIEDIQGGEHHTLILYKDGRVYGSGKNDEGQLGELDEEGEPFGTFKRLTHLPFKPSRLLCSSHFTYALDEQKMNYWAWGFGYAYVLGNGKEDSLFRARMINNEKFFPIFPQSLAMGTVHVCYFAGALGSEQHLDSLLKAKKKRAYRGPNLLKPKTKLMNNLQQLI